MSLQVGQVITTALRDADDHAAVGDVREIVDWQTKIVLARYRVTEMKGRLITAEVIEAIDYGFEQ